METKNLTIDSFDRGMVGYMDQCDWAKDYMWNYIESTHRFGEEEVKRYLSFRGIKSPEHRILEEFITLTTKDKKWPQATELLVQYIKQRNRIYTTKDDLKSEVWIYKDGIYVPHGRSEVKYILRTLLGELYTQYIYGLVIAKIEADTFIDTDFFFNQPVDHDIPVMNGLLNLKTRHLRPFNPQEIFFFKLPVRYDPAATCPAIDAFLNTVLSHQSDKDVFYELGGFCLMNEYKFEKAAMFVGGGRNGKDKSLELIKRLIGVENCCAVSLASLDSNSFVISEFYGKKVNMAGDISNQDLKDTSMFKALTGRSFISAKRKFLPDIHFVNNAKFIFACNELPMVYDTSKGFWDRWLLLEFPKTFVSKIEYEKAENKTNLEIRDEDIIDKITVPQELSGLLNQFLDGFDRLHKHRQFSTTKGSDEVKSLWIRKSNSFIAFCMDRIVADYQSKLSKKDLRKEYSDYCNIHKINPKSDIVIKRVLQDMYGASDSQDTFGSFSERVWEGIKWKA